MNISPIGYDNSYTTKPMGVYSRHIYTGATSFPQDKDYVQIPLSTWKALVGVDEKDNSALYDQKFEPNYQEDNRKAAMYKGLIGGNETNFDTSRGYIVDGYPV